MAGRLAVMFNPRVSVLQLVEAAGGAWHPMWLVDREAAPVDDSLRLLSRLGAVIDITGLDAADRAARVGEYQPDGIIAFGESELMTAARIGAALGLPVNSTESVSRLTNKLVQRRALQDAGLRVPRFWAAQAGMDEAALRELVRAVSGPAIVKPQTGDGSRETYRAACNSALEQILRENDSTDLIVEELLPDAWNRAERPYADFVSVESVLADGQLHHLAVTGRGALAEPFMETGNFIPAQLPAGLDTQVIDLAGQAIAAIAPRTGCFHTEIKLTPDGPRIIEINGRIGGSIPELFQLAGLPSLLNIACRAALGLPIAVDQWPAPRRIGYSLVQPPPVWASRLSRLDHVEDVSGIPGVDAMSVNRLPGAKIDWREGYEGRIYLVYGAADDHDAMWAARRRIQETLTVEFS